MSKLRPKSLKFEGFRSFREPARVDFTDGAILIKGPVSGSGKSSIVVAMAYALGFSAPPATELKNWYSKKMKVELILTDGEKDISIVRDPKLSVTCGDTTKTGKDAESFLDEVLGVDRELAETLTYREQRKPGAFLYKTDSDRKEFLARLIPSLKEIETAHDGFAADLTNLIQKIAILDAEVKSIEGFLSANANAHDKLLAAQAAFSEVSVEFHKLEASSEKEKELRQIEATVSDRLRQSMQVQQKAQILKHENENLRTQMVALKSDIDSMQKSICPTCRREWLESMDMVGAKQEKLKVLLEKFQSNTVFQKNAQPVIDAMPELNAEILSVRDQLSKLSAPKDAVKRALDLASYNRHECIRQANAYDENLKKAGEKKSEMARLSTEAVIAQHMSEIFGRNGFMGVIFDEVLGEIESRANDMMAFVPNVNRFTLSISSVSTMKNGNTKRSISVKLHCDAMEVSVPSLSGGQKVVTELCIDLAIAETIRKRSGCRLGWIVLDEAMDGLDMTTKQSVLDMIASKVNGQVIVIDHATEVQEGFSKIIEIQFDGRDSKIA
jgi:DNA repair exonuclease SbcCD ATPase subunit